jgi:hypothetical protein
LSNTQLNSDFVYETFGHITRLTISGVETLIEALLLKTDQEDSSVLKENILNSINGLFKSGSIDSKVIDSFCGTYEDHGFITKLLEHSNKHSDILNVCEMLYYVLALEKTCHFLTQPYASVLQQTSSENVWRKLSEFFAKVSYSALNYVFFLFKKKMGG